MTACIADDRKKIARLRNTVRARSTTPSGARYQVAGSSARFDPSMDPHPTPLVLGPIRTSSPFPSFHSSPFNSTTSLAVTPLLLRRTQIMGHARLAPHVDSRQVPVAATQHVGRAKETVRASRCQPPRPLATQGNPTRGGVAAPRTPPPPPPRSGKAAVGVEAGAFLMACAAHTSLSADPFPTVLHQSAPPGLSQSRA